MLKACALAPAGWIGLIPERCRVGFRIGSQFWPPHGFARIARVQANRELGARELPAGVKKCPGAMRTWAPGPGREERDWCGFDPGLRRDEAAGSPSGMALLASRARCSEGLCHYCESGEGVVCGLPESREKSGKIRNSTVRLARSADPDTLLCRAGVCPRLVCRLADRALVSRVWCSRWAGPVVFEQRGKGCGGDDRRAPG